MKQHDIVLYDGQYQRVPIFFVKSNYWWNFV